MLKITKNCKSALLKCYSNVTSCCQTTLKFSKMCTNKFNLKKIGKILSLRGYTVKKTVVVPKLLLRAKSGLRPNEKEVESIVIDLKTMK